MQCDGFTRAGDRCRAPAARGGDKCFKHSTDPDVQRDSAEANRAGGLARAGDMSRRPAEPLALDVSDLDLTTVAGLREYVARALLRLAELPFDVRVANSVAQLVTCQRAVLASDIEELRAAVTELMAERGLRRVA